MRPWMGTLNSLVVDREWRGRPCASPRTGELARPRACSFARAVEQRRRGSPGAGGDRSDAVSARALMRAGFRVIDRPVLTELHAEFPMCNVGIVLRPRDGAGRALAKYSDDREGQVLRGTTIDAQFASAKLMAAS